MASKARGTARSGKVFRMKALTMKREVRGRGLAAEALKRLQVELGELAGTLGRLQDGGRHGSLHGKGGCGLLCQARLDW